MLLLVVKLKPDVRQQIDEDIQTINMLMDKNRQTIAALRKRRRSLTLRWLSLTNDCQCYPTSEEKEHEIEHLRKILPNLTLR